MTLESYITSLQQIDLAITNGNTSNSANLNGDTVVTNCIPFVTMDVDGTSDDWASVYIDVYLTAGSPPTVTIERIGSTGDITASIFIIEFNGTNVEVTQGTFDIESGELTTQEAFIIITLTKSFATFFYKISADGDDNYDHTTLQCWFSDSTHIDWERTWVFSVITGHYYIAEAQGTEFTTEAIGIELDNTETSDTQTISEVTMAKTMIVANCNAEVGLDYVNRGGIRVWLTDSTTVTAEHFACSASAMHVKGWVVEFAASSNISVQRGLFSYANSDAQESTDILVIVEAESMLNNPMIYGFMEADGNASEEVEGAYQRLTFVDADTIVGDRTAPVEEAYGNWEVISFTAAAAGDIDEVQSIGLANISEVMGVAKANISEVMGVSGI